MEELLPLEMSYDEDDYQEEELIGNASIEMQPQQLEEESSNVEAVVDRMSTRTPQEALTCETEDGLELSKRKLKDNLSAVCKENLQNVVKEQVKADVALKCATRDWEEVSEESASLQAFSKEMKFQKECIKNKLILEQTDSAQIVKQMETVGLIVSVLKEKLADLMKQLDLEKQDFAEFSVKMESDLADSELQGKLFQEEFERNNKTIEQLTLQLNQEKENLIQANDSNGKRERALDENIENLQREYDIQKKKNAQLKSAKNTLQDQLADGEKVTAELEEQVELVCADVEKAAGLLKDLKDDGTKRINMKTMENEILNEKLSDRLLYLEEINAQIEQVNSQNVELAEENNRLREETSEREIKYEKLVEELNENRLMFKREMESLTGCEEKLQLKLKDIDFAICTTKNNNDEVALKTDALRKELEATKSTTVALKSTEIDVKQKLNQQQQIRQSHLAQKSQLSDQLASLSTEFARVTKKKSSIESELVRLQDEFAKETEVLQEELLAAEGRTDELLLSKQKFEELKGEREEKLDRLKADHEKKLSEMASYLQQIQNENHFNDKNKQELSEKFQSKIVTRDSLCKEYKALEGLIKKLEGEVAAKSKNPPQIQKPSGILKSAKLKSPQKKVTFEKSLMWDSFSETSADVEFARRMKNKSATTSTNNTTMDELFDILCRNSPPERENAKPN